jgi:eukaryotic-like serine/threonine-protein kinase
VLVTAANDVRTWNVRTGRELGAPLGPGRVVAVSSDGRTIAAGGADGAIRLWDRLTRMRLGGLLRPPRSGLDDEVQDVVFSPDGRRVAASTDAGAGVWDTSWHTLLDVPAFETPLDLAFSPDGRVLAAAESPVVLRDTVAHRAVATQTPIGVLPAPAAGA